MDGMNRRVLILMSVLVVVCVPVRSLELPDVENVTNPVFEEKLKQMVWKKCSQQVTPTCIKLTLMQLVDRLSEETNFQPMPGVLLSSNRSRVLEETDSDPNELPPLDRLDGLLVAKVKGYLKSLTLSVRLMDAPVLNTTDIMESVVSRVTGRKKGGGIGVGALGVMLGGGMMTMMMAALAAMAGKALMTSMMALMLAAMGAMKGGGGGGGGGKSTTYEIIAQPEVSHMHTHSSEVQHGHHGWKRSVDQQRRTWPPLPDEQFKVQRPPARFPSSVANENV